MQELKRGHDIVSDIYGNDEGWSKLFEEGTFFTDYKHYVEITAETEDEEDRQKWWVVPVHIQQYIGIYSIEGTITFFLQNILTQNLLLKLEKFLRTKTITYSPRYSQLKK